MPDYYKQWQYAASGDPLHGGPLDHPEFGDFVSSLERMEQWVVEWTEETLEARIAFDSSVSDDGIFDVHGRYTEMCCRAKIPHRSAELWINDLSRCVGRAEKELKRRFGPEQRLHKGAPLYNVGMCHFAAGDFDRGLIYFAQSGIEDDRSGERSRFRVLVGDHHLSKMVLIDPVVRWASDGADWCDLYRDVTEQTFEAPELKRILEWAGSNRNDAMQIIVALHRLVRTETEIDNEASQHLRTRALADLVIVVESTLRRWQVGVGGQLHHRMVHLLNANPSASARFKEMESLFRKPGESIAELNRAVDECLARIAVARASDERVGLACYLTWRLRNSLMHVIDSSLNIVADRPKLIRVSALVFGCLRISMRYDK